MPLANQPVQLIETLHDAIARLEASVVQCLSKPGKEQVHRLRTSVRRVEAHLELLSLLGRLSPEDVHTREARRLLRQFRRVAGRVRDLDVQNGLIQSEASAQATDTQHERSARAEARKLMRKLKQEREEEVGQLLRLLHRKNKRLPRILEEVLATMRSAGPVKLSQSQLIALVRGWYQQAGGRDAPTNDVAGLHDARKRAKLARYLAESAPPSALAARRLAARFAAVQRAGGEWHDWLVLTETASGELGDSAELPRRFAAYADRALLVFQRRIREVRAMQPAQSVLAS